MKIGKKEGKVSVISKCEIENDIKEFGRELSSLVDRNCYL
jgi:hypothetical protein